MDEFIDEELRGGTFNHRRALPKAQALELLAGNLHAVVISRLGTKKKNENEVRLAEGVVKIVAHAPAFFYVFKS